MPDRVSKRRRINHDATPSLLVVTPVGLAISTPVILFRKKSVREIEKPDPVEHEGGRTCEGDIPLPIDDLKLATHGLKSRIEHSAEELRTVEDLTAFAASRANDLRLTEPRLAKLKNIEGDFERLFSEPVEEQTTASLAEESPAQVLPPRLGEVFYRLQQAREIWRSGTITCRCTNESWTFVRLQERRGEPRQAARLSGNQAGGIVGIVGHRRKRGLCRAYFSTRFFCQQLFESGTTKRVLKYALHGYAAGARTYLYGDILI
jgi:hypothetical protein